MSDMSSEEAMSIIEDLPTNGISLHPNLDGINYLFFSGEWDCVYLDADDCLRLSEAFRVIGEKLKEDV